ncbi:metal-dependent hydrolase [Enterococcus sp. 2201sp1_2201st1_B8_2201SCRN_220225]|uniref:metal-dependent hydrolase n=1 Tax=unclassified Enterococcus TaxID=2608891 RepID=UPI0034A2D9BE
MEITYHGHATVAITTKAGHKILIDPFFTGNPLADISADEVEADYILITHGHSDHIGDMVAIAKRCDAMVIAMVEIAEYAANQGVKKTHGMNLGGSFTFPFGRVKLVPAQHSSSLTIDGVPYYMGLAAGLVLTIEDQCIYHAGDTNYFSDMQLIGREHLLDLAFLPIGDNFTMGPEEALLAASVLNAGKVVPIHFNTFPVIEQDATAFAQKLPTGTGQVLQPGETITLEKS